MRPDMFVWLVPLLAFGVAWFVTRQCCEPDSRLYFLDHPNARSLHQRPTPRTGGVGVMAGVLVAGVVLALLGGVGTMPGVALLGALGLAALGLMDDRRSLPARWRFVAQSVAAAGFLAVLAPTGGIALVMLLLVALVWMANLYNFMDGSDGLAGGMAVFGFGFFTWAGAEAGQLGLAALCASIAAAAAGFLVFNLHPARIFMGDVGSVPLGFLAGTLGVAGWHSGAWPLWFAPAVFSPFIFDATVTLLRRALRGEKVWQAHRTHYYQRLVQMGLGHRGVAWSAYGLMAGVGISALLARHMGFSLQCGMITIWLLAYLLLGGLIDRAWRRFQSAQAIKS